MPRIFRLHAARVSPRCVNRARRPRVEFFEPRERARSLNTSGSGSFSLLHVSVSLAEYRATLVAGGRCLLRQRLARNEREKEERKRRARTRWLAWRKTTEGRQTILGSGMVEEVVVDSNPVTRVSRGTIRLAGGPACSGNLCDAHLDTR